MNKELYDNTYKIPDDIIKYIRSMVILFPNNDGIKHAKNLINNPKITYQNLKKIKNFFENFNPATDDNNKFKLYGGLLMKNFTETTLENERKRIENKNKTINNINPDITKGLKVQRDFKIDESEVKLEVESKNVVIVIISEDRRILLLKRSSYPDQWMPNKFNLVGGKVEDGEEPIEAAKREIKEETGLVINKFIEKFTIQRNGNLEYIFIAKYDGDIFNIKLDKENDGYVWVTYNEIFYLDTVPNLIDYINIALKEYD